MLAAFCTAPGSFDLREVPRPQLNEAEVLVRVRACGICGSDLDWYQGHFPVPAVCPGHEIAGEIVEVEAGEPSFHLGERVAVEPLVPCGRCPACRVGDYQICPEVRVLGVALNGGFAEYVSASRQRLYKLPAGLDFAAGALAEPAAVCVHGVRLGNISPGDRVLVFGAGTIGLLSIMAARTAGAAEVAITARHAHQAEMARRLGATEVFPVTPEGNSDRARWSTKLSPDVVIETLGGQGQVLNDAIESVRPGGTVVLLGVFLAPPPINALAMLIKEVRLVGSMTYGCADRRSDFEIALQMLNDHRSAACDLVTHRFELEQIRNAFETAADKKNRSIKVVVAQ